MSTVFRVWCTDDAVAGPQLHRKPGGSGLIDSDAWGAFLIEHQYHQLVLVHEDMDGQGAPDHALRVEEGWEMGPAAAPLPPFELRDGDMVTPAGALTGDHFRAAGWKMRRRLVTDWVDA